MADCSQLVHANERATRRDVHVLADESGARICDIQPCPFRLSAPGIPAADERFERCTEANQFVAPAPEPTPIEFDVTQPEEEPEEDMANQITSAQIMAAIAALTTVAAYKKFGQFI